MREGKETKEEKGKVVKETRGKERKGRHEAMGIETKNTTQKKPNGTKTKYSL